MNYAPMMIPTLCRANHFIRCVESLKRNSWAHCTDIYIALDYPAKEEHWEGYRRICEYLDMSNFSCFASFNVVKREVNYGSGRNSRELREWLFGKYDRVIRTDDDVEFSPNFLEYMDKTLEQFAEDDNVIAVCGYSYPIQWDMDEKSNVMLENIVVPMWGTGFWRSKFEECRKYLESGGLIIDFPNAIKTKKYKNLTKAGWYDYAIRVTRRNPYNSMLCRVSDISMRIYLAVNDKYVVSPSISKSRNWGFDGSGVYCENISGDVKGKCARDYLYAEQPIDENVFFEVHLDTRRDFNMNRKKLDSFDKRSLREMIRANYRVMFYRILGEKIYRKLIELVRGGYGQEIVIHDVAAKEYTVMGLAV